MRLALRFIGGFLLGCSVVTLVALCWWLIDRNPLQVVIYGELLDDELLVIQHRIEVEAAANGNWLSALEVAEAVHEIPWTEEVSVWRSLWNVLHVQVDVQQVMARVDNESVLTELGQVIPTPQRAHKDLPTIDGIDSHQDIAGETAAVIVRLNQVLSDHEIDVATFQHLHTGWLILLESGDSVLLGRYDLEDRLQRFLAVYTQFQDEQLDGGIHADARYDHGVAVVSKRSDSWQLTMLPQPTEFDDLLTTSGGLTDE